MTSGLFQTAAGSLGERWLEEHQGAVRAFFVVRSRSVDTGDVLFEEFREATRRLPASQLRRGPTPRARLFLVARQVLELRELLEGPPGESVAPPWEPVARLPIAHRRAVEALRHSLPYTDSEILELHYVRGLSISDVAYVRGETEEQVVSRLKAAEAYALWLIEEHRPKDQVALDTLLEEAFRLDELPAVREFSSAHPAPPLGPGVVLSDRYEIELHVAAGAFGHVYRARDVLVPGHQVALKLLHRRARVEAAKEGAIRELSLLASVFHPSVVQFKDHGWYDERLWFVMPWYDGETLKARLQRGPMDVETALNIFEPLARALSALHAAGIRHQDVKPDNVFLVELGAHHAAAEAELLPVLLDLGGAAPDGDMNVVGTPMYFAPEVAERFVSTDPTLPLTDRADVYALALSLAHSLAPEQMEQSERAHDFQDFVRRRQAEKLALPRRLPHHERFARWLHTDPAERPSAAALAAELKALRRLPRRRLKTSLHAMMLVAVPLLIGLAIALGGPGSFGSRTRPHSPTAPTQVMSAALRQRLVAAEERAAALEARLESSRACGGE